MKGITPYCTLRCLIRVSTGINHFKLLRTFLGFPVDSNCYLWNILNCFRWFRSKNVCLNLLYNLIKIWYFEIPIMYYRINIIIILEVIEMQWKFPWNIFFWKAEYKKTFSLYFVTFWAVQQAIKKILRYSKVTILLQLWNCGLLVVLGVSFGCTIILEIYLNIAIFYLCLV